MDLQSILVKKYKIMERQKAALRCENREFPF